MTERDEEESIWKTLPLWRAAPFDALVLILLLLTANWFVSRADPGWLRLNPTPWLLLPLFLGGRYGAGFGILGALLATASVLGLQFVVESFAPVASLQSTPFFFLALLLGGAVGAAIHSLVRGPVEKLRSAALNLAEKNRRLEEDAALFRANELKLMDSLLLHGAETVSLNQELKQLFADDQSRVHENFLALLGREFGIISAAIYRDDSGKSSGLSRIAQTNVGSADFPESFRSVEIPLASAALRTGKMATWKSLEAPAGGHFAAIPWSWSPDRGRAASALLLINRIDFARIDWENLSRIEAVFGWTMAQIQSTNHPEPGNPSRFVVAPEAAAT